MRDWRSARLRCSNRVCSAGRIRNLTASIVSLFITPVEPALTLRTPAAIGLSKIKTEQIAEAMQVSDTNPMTGIEGRATLLIRLGLVLSDPANAAYFTAPDGLRPGGIIDYLLAHPSSQQVPSPSSYNIAVKIETLWDIVVNGLSGVWPEARSKIDGVSLGDVWPVDCLKGEGKDPHVSFHKLSQWLSYSLIEV